MANVGTGFALDDYDYAYAYGTTNGPSVLQWKRQAMNNKARMIG